MISKHFEPESIIKQSSAYFIPEADRDKVQPAIELMKSTDAKWRVDIRPESIAMVDYAQLKQERTEFLTAMATFVQSAQAAAKEIPGSTPILLEMMKWTMSGFKGSTYLEGEMDRLIDEAKKAAAQPQQQDQGPNPEAMKLQIESMKMQAQQQKTQAEMQKMQMKAQMDMQSHQAKLQAEIQKIQAETQSDMTIEQQQSQAKLLELSTTLENDIKRIRAELESSLQIEQAQAEFDMALENARHDNTIAQTRIQQRGQQNGP